MPPFLTARPITLRSLTFSLNRKNINRRLMVTLVVVTTVDPASIGPASALLSMPGCHPGPFMQDMASFVNKDVRLLKHDYSNVREDHLDKRWETATGKVVDEVIFLSRHTAASNRPALTIHPIGVPHQRVVNLDGPITDSPTMFVEIGSTEEYWKRQDAAQAIALVQYLFLASLTLVWKGLGLDGGIPVGDWRRNNGKNKILLGLVVDTMFRGIWILL